MSADATVVGRCHDGDLAVLDEGEFGDAIGDDLEDKRLRNNGLPMDEIGLGVVGLRVSMYPRGFSDSTWLSHVFGLSILLDGRVFGVVGAASTCWVGD